MPIIPAGYLGDVTLGQTLTWLFNVTDVADAPINITGSPNMAAYVNGSTTQITAGLTLTLGHDGVTGLYKAVAVLTSGNGFATASDIDFTLEGASITVDGVSCLGKKIGSVSIGNRSSGGGGGSDPWATALPGAYGAGTAGKILGDLPTAVAGVQSDTDDIQARLPAALVGGRMDASVGA